MQNQVTQSPVAEGEDRAQGAILALLLDDPGAPWSVDELARELRSEVDAVDAVASLYAAGLVHRSGELVFATRAVDDALRLGGGLKPPVLTGAQQEERHDSGNGDQDHQGQHRRSFVQSESSVRRSYAELIDRYEQLD
jgi:hypothetical protein